MSFATRSARPQAAPLPAPPSEAIKPAPAPAAAAPERPSHAGAGDRVALVVWLGAASMMAFLLLKDLAHALLF